MIILGLHFGHDASVSVIKDGEVLLCTEIERHRRIKYTIGLEYTDIEKTLKDCKLTVEDVDYATLTSTQFVDYIFPDPKKLCIKLERLPVHDKHGCTLSHELKISSQEFFATRLHSMKPVLESEPDHTYHPRFLSHFKNTLNNTFNNLRPFEKFIDTNLWAKRRTFEEIAATDYRKLFNDSIRHGFHYPAVLELNSKRIPAYLCSHHYAHVCYSFYQGPFEEAAILSQDGAFPAEPTYLSGFFAYGIQNKLYSFTPNNLMAGNIYDMASGAVGFKDGAGKLMGLAAYGKPRFFAQEFVGNRFDTGMGDLRAWESHCLQQAKLQGYDLKPFGDVNQILAPINIDFAASTQKLIEEIFLAAAATLSSALENSGKFCKNLCIAGGTALNCPANSRIYNESSFHNVHVSPTISDAGLSIGSALGLYYNTLGFERQVKTAGPKQAYLGIRSSCESEIFADSIKKYSKEVKSTKLSHAAKTIADDLCNNKIIALFFGRSEVGPRALGHRSILANPQYLENWERTNRIKGRELWRPFAPIVLEGEEEKYFSNCPFPSYFMLFNAVVKTGQLPAITHVDRTSRIQSVNKDCGLVHAVLEEFKKQGNIPVLMNTSFNGHGEPIVETPEHAIQFLLSTAIDAVYLEHYKLERR